MSEKRKIESALTALAEEVVWHKKRIAALEAEVAGLRGLLREVQWRGVTKGYDYERACPICKANRDEAQPHKPDCRLAAALKEGE